MAIEQRRARAGWNVGVIALMIAAMLIGLPLAVWLDLHNLAKSNLLSQANDVNSVISGVRSYYSMNVVGRILSAPEGPIRVSAHFETIPGAIPIPATLSLGLGRKTFATDSSPTIPSGAARPTCSTTSKPPRWPAYARIRH
jgi:adenylate cyclase